MPLAAAAAIGAAGSIGGALIQSGASKEASQQQATSSANALALQAKMFGISENALSPFINSGKSAVPGLQGSLSNLNALLSPGNQTSALSQLPGFQFQSQWGTQTAKNSLAAMGLGGSTGPLAKAISDYNNGLAGTSFNSYVNNLLGGVGANQGAVNSGVGAASALAGNATMAGNYMGQTTQNIGNAQAAGTLGSSNALAGGLTSATGTAGNALLMNALLNQNQNQNAGIYGVGHN